MSTALRERILAKDDLKRVPVEVPEWGETIHVRVMSGTQRDQFESAFLKDRSTAMTRLVALTACDEAGNLLFTEADVPALGHKSWTALQTIFNAAARLNKLSEKDVDELEKN
jgi:hypothetical protein